MIVLADILRVHLLIAAVELLLKGFKKLSVLHHHQLILSRVFSALVVVKEALLAVRHKD